MVCAVCESDLGKQLGGAQRRLTELGREFDILQCRESGEQVIELKDKADMLSAVVGERWLVAPVYRPSLIAECAGAGSLDASEYIHHGALAGAGGAQYDDELLFFHCEGDSAQRMDAQLAEHIVLGDILRTEYRVHSTSR